MEIKEAVKKLILAKSAYYNSGSPIMTDQEYDSLEGFVKNIDPQHPILAKIGSEPSSVSWKKAKHKIPMGSLQKVHTEEDFRKWASKFPADTIFVAQPKLDGLSLELRYDSGPIAQAITRGDGSEGEDITTNAKRMSGIVNDVIMPEISIRSEVLLPKEDFDKINDILEDKDKYKNPRNAASGIIRRLDGAYCQYLTIIAYDVCDNSNLSPDEKEKIKILESLDFKVPITYSGGIEAMVEAFSNLKRDREKFAYSLDGVVIKINSSKFQKELGYVDGRPKSQIAWKFEPPGAITTFIKETWEVGRTGVVTPLAHLEPVEIDGSIISKATLHNVAEIKRLGIGRGDTIMLVKRGDIIPKCESVIEHKGNPIEIPWTCPSCGESLENDGIRLFCKNDRCPAKNFYRIMNWIKITKIDTFGESLADKLFELGKVKEIKDLYNLTPKDISEIEGWGEQSGNTIIDNIEKTRMLPADVFLSAIGIPGISHKTSEDLITNFETMDRILEITPEDIIKIKGYSDISAESIISGLKKFSDEIGALLAVIKIEPKGEAIGKLSEMSFCFTGALSKPRTHYQDLVKSLGGRSLSTVTKDLNYLVCNEDKGSSKSVKAKKLNVKVINEQEFINLIGYELSVPAPKPTIENVSLF